MFNRQIEITRENESILFINAVVENLRYHSSSSVFIGTS